jgi:hypothetical protein
VATDRANNADPPNSPIPVSLHEPTLSVDLSGKSLLYEDAGSGRSVHKLGTVLTPIKNWLRFVISMQR